MKEVFIKFKITRKELKEVKNKNLQHLAKISCLIEDLQKINDAPKEGEEALERLRELELENTRIIKENILKEPIEFSRLVALAEPLVAKA